MTDAERFGNAIGYLEALLHELYVSQSTSKELGDIKTQYDAAKASLEVIKQQSDQLSAQFEAAKTEFATVQQQEVATRQRVAALDREVEEKLQMLRTYSASIDRITGAAA
jgi:uncharacterized protein (DUF3084 family)